MFISYETIVINPTIVRYGNETYFPIFGEDCLSVQDPILGKMKRYKQIEVRYYDLNGNQV